VIAIPRALVATICRGAERAYPEECCGLLVGRAGPGEALHVTRAVPSPNLAADRRRGFEVDAALYVTLRRGLSGGPERLLGLYHSHPDGPAEPSPRDAAEAWQEGWIWLIVPVAGGRAATPSAHRLSAAGGPFRPVEIRISGGRGEDGTRKAASR
jgi:proteasome lid subunit RPN8/RPN11